MDMEVRAVVKMVAQNCLMMIGQLCMLMVVIVYKAMHAIKLHGIIHTYIHIQVYMYCVKFECTLRMKPMVINAVFITFHIALYLCKIVCREIYKGCTRYPCIILCKISLATMDALLSSLQP